MDNKEEQENIFLTRCFELLVEAEDTPLKCLQDAASLDKDQQELVKIYMAGSFNDVNSVMEAYGERRSVSAALSEYAFMIHPEAFRQKNPTLYKKTNKIHRKEHHQTLIEAFNDDFELQNSVDGTETHRDVKPPQNLENENEAQFEYEYDNDDEEGNVLELPMAVEAPIAKKLSNHIKMMTAVLIASNREIAADEISYYAEPKKPVPLTPYEFECESLAHRSVELWIASMLDYVTVRTRASESDFVMDDVPRVFITPEEPLQPEELRL